MPRGKLLEYCVDPQHLVAHPTTTSSSRAKFKAQLLLGSPTYSVELLDLWCLENTRIIKESWQDGLAVWHAWEGRES